MRKASRSVILLYCGSGRIRTCEPLKCGQLFSRQPPSATRTRFLLFYWDSVPNYLNSPDPLFKGAIRAYGLSIAACLPCSPTPARHLMMPCYFIGTLSQTLTLRAAFTSSTYLLSQIPGPGRSSDDDLLNLIPPTPFSRGHIRPSCAPELGANASLFFGRHLMMPWFPKEFR